MAFSTITDADLLTRITDVFRTYGFDGATLSRLATETGLEKSSLYHRFPGGKEQMALAVAAGVAVWFETNVFAILKGDGSPQERLSAVAKQLRTFYAEGSKPCVLDLLSLPTGSPELAEGLKGALIAWQKAFAEVAEESGFSPLDARSQAEDAIMRIEGSLIMSRVLGDPGPFHRSLEELSRILIPPA